MHAAARRRLPHTAWCEELSARRDPLARLGRVGRRRHRRDGRAMRAASASARAAARRTVWTRLLMGAPLALMLVVFLVYPVGQLLLLSIYTDNGFSLAHYRQLFASSVYVDVLLITLKISLYTTLLSVIAA